MPSVSLDDRQMSICIYQALKFVLGGVMGFRYNVRSLLSRLPPKYLVVWLLCTLPAYRRYCLPPSSPSFSLLTEFFFKNGLRHRTFTMSAQVVLEHGYKRDLVILSVYYLRQSRNSDDRMTVGDTTCASVCLLKDN